ncbi:MAG: hypothetical protein KY449_07380, partial [Proteobacteria bacterium]|nr:hypothetical protein [Pseudomonadota bacterium]
SLEQWRAWLSAHLRSLQRQPNYRLVRAHGLVLETDLAVRFYFERMQGEPSRRHAAAYADIEDALALAPAPSRRG